MSKMSHFHHNIMIRRYITSTMFLVYSSILVCLNEALNVYHDIIVIGKIKIMIYEYSNYHEEQM